MVPSRDTAIGSGHSRVVPCRRKWANVIWPKFACPSLVPAERATDPPQRLRGVYTGFPTPGMTAARSPTRGRAARRTARQGTSALMLEQAQPETHWVTPHGTYHRIECPLIAKGHPATEYEVAKLLTHRTLRPCLHCEPRVTPAGTTPGERQHAAWAATPQGQFRARFGRALNAREAQALLLAIDDDTPGLVGRMMNRSPSRPRATP